MRDPNSPSLSLFDQLGAGMDIMGQVPVPKVHRYAEDANEGEIAPSEIPAESLDPMQSLPDNMTDMKFTHSLIKHLDMLYSRMLAGEISEMNDENMVEIGGQPHVQTRSWYNPGNSNVTESF